MKAQSHLAEVRRPHEGGIQVGSDLDEVVDIEKKIEILSEEVRRMSCQCQGSTGGSSEKFAVIDRIVEAYAGQDGALIPVLHQAQEVFGYLPEDVQAYIAEKLAIPLSEVYGVVSFYTLFSTEPKGQHKISVCLGTACYVKGAGNILAEFEKELGIKVGETTKDGLFTLEACRCLGACGLAPVLTIDGDVHGRLVTKDVATIINKYKASN